MLSAIYCDFLSNYAVFCLCCIVYCLNKIHVLAALFVPYQKRLYAWEVLDNLIKSWLYSAHVCNMYITQNIYFSVQNRQHVIDLKSQCHRTKPLMWSWRYISRKYKCTQDFYNQYLFVHKLWINSNKRIQHQHKIYTCKKMSSFAKDSIKFLKWNHRNTHWISALFGGITFHNDRVWSLNHRGTVVDWYTGACAWE